MRTKKETGMVIDSESFVRGYVSALSKAYHGTDIKVEQMSGAEILKLRTTVEDRKSNRKHTIDDEYCVCCGECTAFEIRTRDLEQV